MDKHYIIKLENSKEKCVLCGQTANYKTNGGRFYCDDNVSKCFATKKKISNKNLGKIPWNKGLTKDTDSRINKQAWNKGLTKETDERIRKSAEIISKALIGHSTGKASTLEKEIERCKKISIGMKKAHAEGRACNIGYKHWDSLPSYPEQFFMDVIKNEFKDQNYEYNKQFHKYKLDFVWIHKKKVIEIDGEQHERYKKQKERDINKNRLLNKENWLLLRIKWKDMFRDTQKWIKIAKEFIDF